MNSNKPESWYSDTDPFHAVRYFSRSDVSDAAIHDKLRGDSTKTLQDLLDRTDHVVAFLKENVIPQFITALTNACQREKKSPEDVLGGEVVYDGKCIPRGCFQMYSRKAVAVVPRKFPPQEDDRINDFTIVLGPSGSGKTLFALKHLPVLLAKHGYSERMFGIHFQAREAVDEMIDDNLSFPVAVANVVTDMITKKLALEKLSEVKTFKISLHVVIDEAGKDSYKKYFCSARRIRKIVVAIHENSLYTFQGVHVTIVGVGLETSTDGIDSLVETTKFRMQPWIFKHFLALVKVSSHPDETLVMEIVRRFPILQDLITNARCAFYLLRAMRNMWFMSKNSATSLVNVLVSSVAISYVESNGLQLLITPSERWAVARSVFRELNKSTKLKGIPFFPEFRSLNREIHCAIANCLLDKHVETCNGNLTFVSGNLYSLSISPALVLVLSNMLNADADITWDWQGFKINVMLSEMKRVVTISHKMPGNPGRLCYQLKSPVSAGTTKKTFSIPVVDRFTVLLNGPMANYADVIAPYRLVHAKFSTDDAGPRELYLEPELDKMGVTTSSLHKLQQTITNVFYTQWRKGEGGPITIRQKAERTVETDRMFCYPFNDLNSRHVKEELKAVVGVLNERENKWEFLSGNESIDDDEILTVFDKKPVTVVFATNCTAFRMKRKRGDGNSITLIKRDDVDYKGRLKMKTLPELGLRKNVRIRFQFF